MVMVETLTDEQIQSCLSEGINLEIFKRHAIVWQKLMPTFYDGKDKYVISDVQTAINYCIEKDIKYCFIINYDIDFDIHIFNILMQYLEDN